MKKYIIAALFLAISLVSCNKGEETNPKDTEQTLFIYMPWSTNLTPYFEKNITDFELAIKNNILKNNRLLVFLASSPSQATLFELKYEKGKCIRKSIKSYRDPDFTTAQWITSILNDVVNTAPAKKYAMIVGSHGMGWLPVIPDSKGLEKPLDAQEKWHWEYEGVPLTRFFGGLSSEFQIDVTTFAEGIAEAGLKMEYILFDDCYMASIEVAYDLRNVTRHLIASPTEIMAHGYPYNLIGKDLINCNYAGICNGFYEFYKNYQHPYGTIGLIDCSQVESLAAIMREINQNYMFDGTKLGDLQRMDGYRPVMFFDLGHYVMNLCQTDTELYARFREQLERTVPPEYSLHTNSYYSMSGGVVKINYYTGATISDPSINPKAIMTKTETAWYAATH